MTELDLRPWAAAVERVDPIRASGEVVELVGLLVESRGPAASVGDFCEIRTRAGGAVRTQVVGFRNGRVLSMPLEETGGLSLGDEIVARGGESLVEVSPELRGRVIDGFGEPMDGGGRISSPELRPLYTAPPNPMEREHIREKLETGIRVIDGLLPCGKGQRIGIFGGRVVW
jgi:flagellar biosynthesis/type III secretory pathway ATPase